MMKQTQSSPRLAVVSLLLVVSCSWLLSPSHAFVPLGRPNSQLSGSSKRTTKTTRTTKPTSTTTTALNLDLISYLRTEWIAAALVTNQTPRSADVCLQLGTEDGRAVTFVPRTIRTLLTSSAERDGKIPVAARRQLKQNEESRKAAKVKILDQPADDLFEVEDESVDVVISLQCAQRLLENGRDWKASVREACRVLKPGGRFLWVEQTVLEGVNYESYLENLYTQSIAEKVVVEEGSEDGEDEDDGLYPVFEDIGWDDVNLVLVPHTAGVAVKALDPALVANQEAQEEQSRMADMSLKAFERGIKKRKKKKKKKKGVDPETI